MANGDQASAKPLVRSISVIGKTSPGFGLIEPPFAGLPYPRRQL